MTSRRFYIRYAVQRWDDTKWFYGIFLVVLIGLVAFNLSRKPPLPIASFLPVIVVDVLILGIFYALYRTSYLEIAPDGLRLRYMMRRVELPYTAVARVRKQPLQVAFQPQERRRYLNRFVRRLGSQPAVYIRIDRRETELLDTLLRRLGPRMVNGSDLVLPITDVEGFLDEIKGRLRGSA